MPSSARNGTGPIPNPFGTDGGFFGKIGDRTSIFRLRGNGSGSSF